MKHVIAAGLGMFLIMLGVSGVAFAQNVVQIQGIIQSVDCGANTLVLGQPNGAVSIVSASAYTAAFVNGTPVGFCQLQQYVGSAATVSVAAAGNEMIAGRIDVTAGIASPYSAPYPYYPYEYGYPYGYYGPYYGPTFVPGIGIGIGVGPHVNHFHGGGMPRPHWSGGTFHGPIVRPSGGGHRVGEH
jgi:hypothetical protein